LERVVQIIPIVFLQVGQKCSELINPQL